MSKPTEPEAVAPKVNESASTEAAFQTAPGNPTGETVPIDAAAGAAHGGAAEAAMDRVQSDLEKFRDLALRSQADFENYKKRASREREEAVKFANFSLFERLIPILDNFELGLSAARGVAEAKPILDGMEMVRRQLGDFLQQHGVEVLEAEGKPFDPNLHEAVSQEPSETVAEGGVVRQIRRGYRLKDRLLRPSMVVVSGGPAQSK
jgi:molecular chaperone GrpE